MEPITCWLAASGPVKEVKALRDDADPFVYGRLRIAADLRAERQILVYRHVRK